MKGKYIVSCIILFGFFKGEAQSTWRFPIAFEDAIGTRDTVWMIWDTSATGGFSPIQVDTNLGEGPYNFNYSIFNVWIYNAAGDSTKTFALPYIYFPNHHLEVRAFNNQYPITVSWDTALFSAPNLPAQPLINYARIDNDYFFGVNNDPPSQMFNMLWDNHASAPAFNWGSQSQFPMNFYLSSTVNVNYLNGTDNSIKVYPNPFVNTINIEAENIINSVSLLNSLSSQVIREIVPNDYIAKISNLDRLSPGLYIIKFVTNKNIYYHEKIIKIP